MALDLARQGVPTHTFPLIESLRDRGLSWEAFATAGYRVAPTGVAAPIFAFGWPFFAGIVYRLFGDAALHLLVPAFGAGSIALTYLLGQRLLAKTPAPRLGGAVAALLLATAPKQIAHSLVPMSDVPAQFFAAMAIWLALQAGASSSPALRGRLPGRGRRRRPVASLAQ